MGWEYGCYTSFTPALSSFVVFLVAARPWYVHEIIDCHLCFAGLVGSILLFGFPIQSRPSLWYTKSSQCQWYEANRLDINKSVYFIGRWVMFLWFHWHAKKQDEYKWWFIFLFFFFTTRGKALIIQWMSFKGIWFSH